MLEGGWNNDGLERCSHTLDAQERSADDGKRFQSDGRCILILSEAKGGGLEEGGLEIGRARRLADYSWVCFSVFFSCRFPGDPFSLFSSFLSAFGGPSGVIC